jgi:hypothetical protein
MLRSLQRQALGLVGSASRADIHKAQICAPSLANTLVPEPPGRQLKYCCLGEDQGLSSGGLISIPSIISQDLHGAGAGHVRPMRL